MFAWMGGSATRTPSNSQGTLVVLSLSVCPCPQVPIIPVVYSSFSSFYNVKRKLFTSGETIRATGAHKPVMLSLIYFETGVHIPQAGLQLLV